MKISNKPNIEGLNFRNFRGESDYPLMVTVRRESAEYDKVDSFSTLESIPTVDDLKNSIDDDNCSPSTDILIVESNNHVIGYSKLGWWTESDGTWLYLHIGYLLPEWRGKGIGTGMLTWSENRIKEIAHGHDAKGKGVYGSNATTTEKEKTKLLLNHGYKKVFSMVEMGFDNFGNLQDMELAEGFVLKPASIDLLRRLYEINDEVYSERNWTQPSSEEDFQELLNNPHNDPSLWYVAYYGDDIAGFVMSEIVNGRGIITEVSVREQYRRKGLASALLIKNLLELKKKGVSIVRLHTNGENVAEHGHSTKKLDSST